MNIKWKNMKKKELKKKVSPLEAELLFAVGCLCNADEISLRSFCDIIGPEKSHEIIESIEALTLKGCYIRYFDGIIYGTTGNQFKSLPANVSLIEGYVRKLLEGTSISIYGDRLALKDYFVMGYSLVLFVERTSPKIDYLLLGELLCNLAKHLDIWYPKNIHAECTSSIPIVRMMTRTLNKIPTHNSVVARLHSYIAFFFLNAWEYQTALKHLKSAEDRDISIYGEIQDYTCLSYGDYYYNYGQLAVALKYYYMAVEMSGNEYAISKIALILALLGEGTSYQRFLDSHAYYLQYLPESHEVNILHCMSLAALAETCDEALRYLDQAELTLNRLNHSETPIGCMLHYIRSQVWAVYDFPAKSLSEYKKYVLDSISNFKPSDGGEGGWAILMSGKIDHYLNYGSICSGKWLSIKELDPIKIYDESLSFSVRSEISKCYVHLYKDLGVFPLARTYSSICETNRKIYKPSQKTLNCIEPLFVDGIPTTITLDTAWENALEQLHIDIYLLEEHQISHNKTIDDIRKDIYDLKIKFPELFPYLMIAEGRLAATTNLMEGIKIWKGVVEKAPEEQQFWVGREIANWCAHYGAIYEAAEMYKRAIESITFRDMLPNNKFDFLLEYVSIIEKTGYRSVAMPYWEQLESIANEEQLPWLYYNRALVEFDHSQWENCRVYLMDFFALYKQVDAFNEILSSAYCYYCSVLIRFGDYESGLEAINKSMALWVDPHSFETLPLYCNKASCEIGLKKWNDARGTLKTAEKFSRTQKDKEIVQDLYDYLHEQRTMYYKGM